MDADEVLDRCDFPSLRACLKEKKDHLLSVPMLHFYGPEPADERQAYVSCAFRLIRRGAGVQLAGKIHETLVLNETDPAPPMECNRFMRILHYGYMDHALERKTGRNIGLLLAEKAKQPEDPWLDYHLAAEYHRSKEPIKAFQAVNAAIVGFLGAGLLPPALEYKLKYDILIDTGSLETAYLGIEKAVALYPDYVDLHFYRAIAQYGRAQYEKAVETFSYCLVLGEANPNYLILSGTGSFFAPYYLGLCYEKQQKYEQAAEAFRQSVAFNPGLEPAKQKLQKLETQMP